jgi:hypothetical protein
LEEYLMATTEETMAEQMGIAEVVDRCKRYWSSTHVPSKAIKEMEAELASHLEEAAGAGKTPSAVIGPDLNEFAEEWARTYRRPMVAGDHAPRSGMTPNTQMLISLIAIAAVTAAILIFSPKEDDVDNEIVQWAFLGGALVLFVGEILTAGFFLLPFAIGAAIAAVMAFLGVAPVVTLVSFLVISVIALIGLQRYTDTDDDQPPVGANPGGSGWRPRTGGRAPISPTRSRRVPRSKSWKSEAPGLSSPLSTKSDPISM